MQEETPERQTEINECQIPVLMDGVLIRPGDFVFGDIDGVVIIPKEIADEVFCRAIETIEKENAVREGLINGDSLEKVYNDIGTI